MKKGEKAKLRAVFLVAAMTGLAALALISMIHASGLVDLTYKCPTAGDVIYRHSTHATEQRLLCKDCHIGIFQMKQGTSGMTNDTINTGEHCGKCHNGERCFSVKAEADCKRCHQPKS
ncbi:MAG: cytochrome c3 family protein [Candidatus Eremiobacteraeota bacterium]|nr:cytochrome c3 family protein [Candidatus Eremiobacteraeota bacterium]